MFLFGIGFVFQQSFSLPGIALFEYKNKLKYIYIYIYIMKYLLLLYIIQCMQIYGA